MSTLVLCVDRTNDIGRKTGIQTPVVGWEAVQSLVVEVGLADPEDSSVNCLLEGLRVTRDLRDEQEDAIVAAVSGSGDSLVSGDRSVAAQLDELVTAHDPDTAIVVIDSVNDEQLVPVIESRLPVDGVDRVVVRQAHDIESTYYLLKQFLADEELRQTVLVPLGVGLLLLPVLLIRFSPAVALAGLASLLGAVLLYKGLAIGERVANLPDKTRTALYSGQVSVVTYAVAGGLTLVGVFLGALAASASAPAEPSIVPAMHFAYSSVPWLALAAMTAGAGRLLDEYIESDAVRAAYLNLPFAALALGLVIRGFAGYFLQQEGVLEPVVLFEQVTISPTQRLALLIVLGIVISLVGVRTATRIGEEDGGDEGIDDADVDAETVE